MRTFLIATVLFLAFIGWLLHKPIPKQVPVARAFTDAEVAYLEKSFDYAMDTLDEGQYLDWSTAGVNGRIAVGKPYTSKQKAICRNYIEVARTHDAQKVDSSIACKRQGKDGWCRVHGDNPQSCALETEESTLKKRARFAILQGSQTIDQLMGTRVGIDTSGLTPHIPKAYVPSIHAPDIQTPDLEPSDFRPPMPWDKN